MRSSKISPYLTAKLGKKKCSHCGLEFPANSQPSISQAFAAHVRESHKAKELSPPVEVPVKSSTLT